MVNPLDYSLLIPQDVLNHYNESYDKHTYNAFRDELIAASKQDSIQGGLEWENAVLNLLIDASFERSGAKFYEGAERSLMGLIGVGNHNLLALALGHLSNFGRFKPVTVDNTEKEVLSTLQAAQRLAEAATQQASVIQSWRGRVAFAWASAAAYLLQAANTILTDTHYDSYPLEKVDRSLVYFRNAVSDAKASGMHISSHFVDWIINCPTSRD
jgi:hypothetical protein